MLHQPAAAFRPSPPIDAAPPSAHPDAALLDLGRQWSAIQREWDDITKESDADANARSDREGAIVDAIVAHPVATADGLAVKARILARETDCEGAVCLDDAALTAWAAQQRQEWVWLDRIVGSLCLDLLRLARESGALATAA